MRLLIRLPRTSGRLIFVNPSLIVFKASKISPSVRIMSDAYPQALAARKTASLIEMPPLNFLAATSAAAQSLSTLTPKEGASAFSSTSFAETSVLPKLSIGVGRSAFFFSVSFSFLSLMFSASTSAFFFSISPSFALNLFSSSANFASKFTVGTSGFFGVSTVVVLFSSAIVSFSFSCFG